MSGSSGSSGSSGEHRHRGRNVRGRTNVRLQQFLPIVPVLAAAVPDPAPPQLPPVAPEPDLELNLELPPPALPPQPLYDPVGDDLVVPDFPPPFPEHQPNPPPVYLDIPGFPELPELPVLDDDDDDDDDNEGGYRHMFTKRLSRFDTSSELNITGQNLQFFCHDMVLQNLLDGDKKCTARLSVLLGGVRIDGLVSLRVGPLNNDAHLAWQHVLGEHGVELEVRQRVFAWYKRMELDGTLRIVIQVVEP